jgi:hypothetical protein
MKNSTTVLATVAALLGAALAGAGVVVYSGVYDVSATSQHLQPVYSLLETTMHHSVRWRARNIATPPLDDAQRLLRAVPRRAGGRAVSHRQKHAACTRPPGGCDAALAAT